VNKREVKCTWYRYTRSKNDVISSVRKRNCALGLVLGLELELELGLW